MASGSSAGRASNSGFKGGVDFASGDVLCSYGDYGSHEASNGSHSDPVIGANSNKDFHKNSVSRSSVLPICNAYTHPENPLNEEVIVFVERTMKKYNDNLMRFLEGISSRLSQLELYCYNLDKSVGEMKSELGHDHGEADAKVKSLDKHLQEVQRSVQILSDKQELADTQKELAKLQLVQKESLRSQQEEKVATPVSVSKKTEDLPETHNSQLALALALPNQVALQSSLPARAPEHQQSVTSQTMTQQPPYYVPATPLPNPAPQPQPSQAPYLPPDSQYRAPQLVQNPAQVQANQPPNLQQLPQYQQQWPQLVAQPQPVQSQAQILAPPSPLYAPYMPSQPANPPQEALMSSLPYGYGGSGRPLQTQSQPQHMKGGDGYPASGTQAPVPSGGSYMMHHGEGSQSQHPPSSHFSQADYHLTNIPLHNPAASAILVIRGPSPPQFVQSHPYTELIDKLVSMGYRGDHVASMIQRLEESGQPVDFNSVLDRLNGHSSGSSQRSW